MRGFIEIHWGEGERTLINVNAIESVHGCEIYTIDKDGNDDYYVCSETYEELKSKIRKAIKG